jgi:nucleoid-associated protein YgaU
MIIKGSRYSAKVETRNEDTKTIAVPSTYSTANFFTIIARSGDTFERLASEHLNNPNMYWKIADINKHVSSIDFIPSGTVIRIPLS